MIHTQTNSSIVREKSDLREWDRMTAYQSMQKTQSNWAQLKQESSESVERDGVSMTISQAARNRGVQPAEPISNAGAGTNQPQIATKTNEVASVHAPVNMNIIMQRMRELSIESMDEKIPEPVRRDMIQEMKKLIEEAERVNKQSSKHMMGMFSDPSKVLQYQRATEAFQAHKKTAPQPELQQPLTTPAVKPVQVVKISDQVHNMMMN